ncbi:MAG: Polynucleotide 5'-hydroxyl-kinase grc3 [Alectoria fallacina]|uniref:Polynucleotide 5'-hydroxyl-kinase GRC3 n=1 Tax=Alectoria fallacina TaxID=1903189 RepID=A0A8H3J9F6_9LECA|nr:MAG: Polynucleotide 5'-hydroxyl-kinase grc3 [Alectoria fallacina]
MAVSAFAARKAARRPIADVTSQIEEQTSLVTETYNDPVEGSKPPRKKQKLGNEPKNKNPRPPQLRDGLVKVQGGSIEVGVKDIESGNGSDSSSVDEPEILVQPTVPVQRLSTFDPSRSSVLSETETEWTVRLNPNDNLAVLGQYDIWVRSGAISILGAVIHASSRLHRVYAPSTHSVPSIRPIRNPFGTGNASVELTIVSCGSRIRMLRQIAPKFGRIWNGRMPSKSLFDISKRSFMNIQTTADDPHHRPLRLLEFPSDWQRTVSRLQSVKNGRPLVIMVCGPKGAGKSTFCRILANALIQKAPAMGHTNVPDNECVAFLDLDPGQPEYSPPGELSLLRLQSWNLGPPFTHPTSGPNQLVRAHHFGHFSPKEDPKHYYRCVLDLLGHYRYMARGYSSCPLIINSAGWIQSNGLELLSDLIHGMSLTDAIYMSTSGPEDVVDTLQEATSRSHVTFHQLTSQSSDFATKSAADFRMMQTLSYFHMSEPEGDQAEMRWNPGLLTRMAPLVIHYAGPKQGILAVTRLGDAPDQEFVESILDGCVVGVVAVDQRNGALAEEYNSNGALEPDERLPDEAADTRNQVFIRRTTSEIPYLSSCNHTTSALSPDRSFSLGQALIRGMDPDNKTIHLLTPIPATAVQAHSPDIVLVRGSLDTPTWAYKEDFEREKAKRRVRERQLDTNEVFDGADTRRWAEKQPWAGLVDGGRGSSGKVRRVRRDVRYRPVGEST